ncbi:DUF5327 family protein [Macrococcus equipercicus]|uniref:DUF5327 family protein n=1 Tax=Macrococcus equipercicus TaxID=69967 RepID=A0A9Q9BTE2_9STAP|nr:DUF5327 family protein [Macrococcus equipercicus]UTH13656.1 DUF5327 family protein [Macrococcus equipercicus]
MNQQLIKQIEHELALAKTAGSQAAFEKHMYAIQTLAALCSSTGSQEPAAISSIKSDEISAAELKMMGGTIKGTTAVTDDGHGNGASLFDF